MATLTKKPRWGAIAGVVTCGLTSFAFLFGDLVVQRDISLFTTYHMGMLAALVCAMVTGHYCTTEWRDERYLLAIGLGLLSAVSIYTVVSLGAARTTLKQAELAKAITTNNEQRATLVAQIAAAKIDMDAAAGDAAIARKQVLKGATTLQADASAAKAACRGKNRDRCTNQQTAANVAATAAGSVAKAAAQATAAAEGAELRYYALQNRLEKLGPEQIPNGIYRAMAVGLTSLPLLDNSPERIEALTLRLAIQIPVLFAIISELGTVLFSSTMRSPLRLVPAAPAGAQQPPPIPLNLPRLPPPDQKPMRRLRGRVDDGQTVVETLRVIGPSTNNVLAKAMGVNPGESTKRRRSVAHLLREDRVGREVVISLIDQPRTV